MWFKNLQIYRLANGWAMTPGGLEAVLAKQPLMPCSGLSLQTRGWVPPVSGEGAAGLVASQGKHLLIAMGSEQKILPASVVNQEALERAAELEQKQGYKPGRKQLRDLKERVTAELLPRAFAKRRLTRAWIDPDARWLVVDASSPARAEELLEQLRNSLGELPVTRLETEMSPQGAMTQWLTLGKATRDFALDSECELKGTGEDGATVRYLRHDLSVKEIREHISGGKLATRVGLVWRERLSLLLVEPFQVKRLKFLEMDKNGDESSFATPEQQFEADFTLMTGTLSALLADLVEALGGEKA
ncbi:MAG: recombination-associated protein RdgC [Nevskiaceae bacterium]|nr:MAG: recombination-associated protein RdgC [Nevskiaceae bacterium]TAM33174.1 MAG: recombination-associated protein RdgC [Nevskiaceae bacterium]